MRRASFPKWNIFDNYFIITVAFKNSHVALDLAYADILIIVPDG
jgi:hypothetical protein